MSLSRRRKPIQPRSVFTVNAVLEATARILTEQGLDRLTTNAVAELAGVSVGSIYQYFPSKEALVAELRSRHEREIGEVLEVAVKSCEGLGFEDSLRVVVLANVEAHARESKLHYLLTERYADVGFEINERQPRFKFAGGESNPIVQHLRDTQDIPLARAKIIGQLCGVIVESMTHAGVVHQQPHLPNEVLVEEIVAAVLGYLDRAV